MLEKQARVGVSQLVKRHIEPAVSRAGDVVARELRGPVVLTKTPAENGRVRRLFDVVVLEPIELRLCMCLEHVHGRVVEAYPAVGREALRLLVLQGLPVVRVFLGGLRERTAYVQPLALKIHVASQEPAQLAAPHARVEREVDGHGEAVVRMAFEQGLHALDLGFVQDVH